MPFLLIWIFKRFASKASTLIKSCRDLQRNEVEIPNSPHSCNESTKNVSANEPTKKLNFFASDRQKRPQKANGRGRDSGNTYRCVIVGELLNPSCAHQRKQKNKKIEEKINYKFNWNSKLPIRFFRFFRFLFTLLEIINWLIRGVNFKAYR